MDRDSHIDQTDETFFRDKKKTKKKKKTDKKRPRMTPN